MNRSLFVGVALGVAGYWLANWLLALWPFTRRHLPGWYWHRYFSRQ